MYVIQLMCLFGVSDDDDADDVTESLGKRKGRWQKIKINLFANREGKYGEGRGKRDLDYTSRVRRTKKDTRVT